MSNIFSVHSVKETFLKFKTFGVFYKILNSLNFGSLHFTIFNFFFF